MRTIITHFYNEEYLLPMWLEHHKKYFDFGVLIDYNSTDRSVEICRDICPNWRVVPSGHPQFDAICCDHEVMFYEYQLKGWKTALTVTEFLVGDLDGLMHDKDEMSQWRIPTLLFTEFDPTGKIDTSKPLWEQFHRGQDTMKNPWLPWKCRSLHNYNLFYFPVGRHTPDANTDRAAIFKYSHCLVGKPMLDRKIQIQHKVSLNDRVTNRANHHCNYKQAGVGLNYESIKGYYDETVSGGIFDLTEEMNKVLKYL